MEEYRKANAAFYIETVERLHGMHFATRRQAKHFDRLRSGDRLAFVLQSPEAARDALIPQPDGLREKTACR